MIQSGDRIALGISGGKDSLALLYALADLRRYFPEKYELVGITVDLGYQGFDVSPVCELCRDLKVPYHVVTTSISQMTAEGGCSLCARLRKGALTDRAAQLGCSKIAYAHNMDDMVETMMLSLIYEGRFGTFDPVTYYEDKKIALIRPLIYTPAAEVKGFGNRYQLPVVTNPCPFEGQTERSYVRELLNDINRHAPGVKKRMMTALMRR